METAEVLGPLAPGCTSPLIHQEKDCDIRIVVDTMTGGRFVFPVSKYIQIYSLKHLIAKRLNVLPDKICLIHRDCVLSSGSLNENGICDLSTIRVFLSMETGTKENHNASCSKKLGAIDEAAGNQHKAMHNQQQDLFKCIEGKQFNEFLSGQVALTVAVKTENHTLLIQLKINSAIAGNLVPTPSQRTVKSGTVVDCLEQIAPGVVQGAFSGTIPICSSPQSGDTFVPVDTVTDIVRDLVTFSAKAIGVPEVAASMANKSEQSISCCGFTTPDSYQSAIENVNPSYCPVSRQPTEAAKPGNNAISQTDSSQRRHDKNSCLHVVENGKTKKASRLSTSHRHHHRRRSSSSSSSSSSRSSGSRSRRSSGSSEKYNEVTRMKMSLLRAMLSK